MRLLSRAFLLAGLAALAVALLPDGNVLGQPKKGKGDFDPVKFDTFDGVTLSGAYYPAARGKPKAVVMLLHHFDLLKGGSSSQDGWGELAADLQKNGFAVLMFDFRGFGSSTDVAPKFWNRLYNHNGPMNIKKRGAAPRTIEHKDFRPSYLPYLANDIAAAKAFLDRKNDNKELNSSNLILIGAGDGATLGAMWLAHQCRLCRDEDPPMLAPGVPRQLPGKLGPPEIRDVTGAIWLTINPSIGTRNVNKSLNQWLREAGGMKHRVPMCFFYGANDKKGDQLAHNLHKGLVPDKAAATKLPSTVTKKIPDTKFTGSQLLDRDLETGKLILKYIDHLTEKTAKEGRNRKAADSPYFVIHPGARFPMLAKDKSDDAPRVDVLQLMPVR